MNLFSIEKNPFGKGGFPGINVGAYTEVT